MWLSLSLALPLPTRPPCAAPGTQHPYVKRAPCLPAGPTDRLAEFFHDPTTRAILALPEADLCSLLVNDAYKARMHRWVLGAGGCWG